MKIIQLLSFLTCMFFSSAMWATTDNRDQIVTILQSISVKPGDEIAFVETKTFDFLDFPTISKGVLSRDRDNTLTKHLIDENELLIISDTKLRKIHNGDETVIVYSDHPKAQQLGLVIRALFTGDIGILEEYFNFYLKMQEQQWVITLVPIKSPLSSLIESIELKGQGEDLEETEILENSGDVITTSFQNKKE